MGLEPTILGRNGAWGCNTVCRSSRARLLTAPALLWLVATTDWLLKGERDEAVRGE